MNQDRRTLWKHLPTLANRQQTPQAALNSRLLELMHTSNVNKIAPQQLADAQQVLALREALLARGDAGSDADWGEITALQRGIIERHLAARAEFYGADQVLPFDDAATLAREGRDTFLIIKFMDEAPHIRATLASLLTQTRVDLGRVVIVAVDNNSTDGSDRIIQETVAEIASKARVIYVNQPVPGGGSAARYGTDRSMATLYRMCELDQNWQRLQTARLAVTDGDTVYHHEVVHALCELFDQEPGVDGVMPFLIYKLTAALRFFRGYRPLDENALAEIARTTIPVAVQTCLSNTDGQRSYPHTGRRRDGDAMLLQHVDGSTVRVPLDCTAPDGRRFGVLQDPDGALAFAFEDRYLVLHRAPVSGFDAALVCLENQGIGKDEQWKWHTAIGHDLFLLWMFQQGGVPEEIVAPDTSDALKMFRCWAFAIGGQHQLSRPGLKIVTGTDYQSGRVLQSVGCLTVLGTAGAWAETEVDRLAKMVRNFANEQSVFYGETRSRGLDRASGLYLHMTRIQGKVEQEIRDYPDHFFRDIAFPERVVFPLRWLLQNAICAYAADDAALRGQLEQQLFVPMFGAARFAALRAAVLHDTALAQLRPLPLDPKRDQAEELAEALIMDAYPEIMQFYARTVAACLDAHGVPQADYAWLFDGIEQGRNALKEARPRVDPAAVWQGSEFVIDQARGQVVQMHDKQAETV
ncbi:glycosyltransferase family 2 protein [Chitiniphilus purpureus]|uniref:Glycosyltransferase family 2 protein n=1 Tax=Chitiniphilus purpureus TaxID=2981137 RepID=A0ABY6DKC0_9NEIS|nr:glycosyltransferase family A protein [Chitiniphilus sp. CD1]UXY14138.1 glycosyltransferase family 2 protein [Chitiniphilus sp. CD1]